MKNNENDRLPEWSFLLAKWQEWAVGLIAYLLIIYFFPHHRGLALVVWISLTLVTALTRIAFFEKRSIRDAAGDSDRFYEWMRKHNPAKAELYKPGSMFLPIRIILFICIAIVSLIGLAAMVM